MKSIKQVTVFAIFWGFLFGLAVVLGAKQKIVTTSGQTQLTVVEFDLFRGEIKITPNIDLINVKVGFTDLPGQTISVKELRDLIKSKPIMKY